MIDIDDRKPLCHDRITVVTVQESPTCTNSLHSALRVWGNELLILFPVSDDEKRSDKKDAQ